MQVSLCEELLLSTIIIYYYQSIVSAYALIVLLHRYRCIYLKLYENVLFSFQLYSKFLICSKCLFLVECLK